MKNKMDRRYLAGLFDGEGCIYYNKKSNKCRKRDTWINICISVCNTYKPIIEKLYNEFGGHFRTHISKYQLESGRYRKVGYELVLCNTKAENFLRECLPYFTIKKERAEIALSIRENVFKYQGYVVPEKEMQRRKSLVDKLSELNEKGVPSLEF